MQSGDSLDSVDSVAGIVSALLQQDVDPDQLLPLIHVLVEGVTEVNTASALGTSLVLCSLLQSRGDEEEVRAQSTVLVGKLYTKLIVIAARAAAVVAADETNKKEKGRDDSLVEVDECPAFSNTLNAGLNTNQIHLCLLFVKNH